MSDGDNVVVLERLRAGLRAHQAGRRGSPDPEEVRPCERHRCLHVAGEHEGRRQARGACLECDCVAFLTEPICDPDAATIVTAASGRVYARCQCGEIFAAERSGSVLVSPWFEAFEVDEDGQLVDREASA